MEGSVAKLCEVRTLRRVTGLATELWRSQRTKGKSSYRVGRGAL